MKVKVEIIIGCSAILQTFSTTKMKIGTAYKIRKIIDECNIIFRESERRRIELLQELNAVPNKETKKYEFPKDNPEAENLFNSRVSEITNQEVEIDVPLVTIAELDNIDGIEIEPALMDQIEWFLDKQEESNG